MNSGGSQAGRSGSMEALLLETELAARTEQRRMVASVISGFAHEVRNPLAAILSLTESALAEMQEQGIPGFGLERVPILIQRIDQLLKVALTFGNPRQPIIEALNLHDLMQTALDSFQASKRAQRPDFDLRIERSQAWVLSDATHFLTILGHLLNNAAEAAEGRSIEVYAESCIPHRPGAENPTSQSYLGISIVDTGPGIGDEAVGRIFDPFFSTRAKGTGLGLSISRDLARLNGGDLILVSTSPKGTEFRLLLRRGSPP